MPEKYIVWSLAICFLLILILIFWIFRAYRNQEPKLESSDNGIFKPEMAFLGSIFKALYAIGFIFYLITFLLLKCFDYQWHHFLLIPLLASFISMIASFIFLFKSFNWNLKYLKYRYIGLVLTTVGAIGLYLRVELNTAIEKVSSLPDPLNLLHNFPFWIISIMGMVCISFSIPPTQE